MSLIDLQARQSALDVTRSFIIEAGAGAGKTSLMVQRYFAGLMTADFPEQVLFCTFTRAATQEMIMRVSLALEFASTQPRPTSEYEQVTYDLAKKVLERDKLLKWGLLFNTSRMNILTLDGLAAKIAKQMPILSGMGGDISVLEDSFPLYNRAAMSVIEAVEETGLISQDVENLMLHVNGNHQHAVDLIAQMLVKRDQWLRHVANADSALDRNVAEDVLQSIIDSVVNSAFNAIKPLRQDLDLLLDFAAGNVDAQDVLSGGSAENEYLLRVSELLLTKSGELRKSVTKAQGFPAGKECAEMKAKWKSVSECVSNDMISTLNTVKSLPVAHYDDSQWDLLNSLFRVLLRAAAELILLFTREGKVDFGEISTRAIQGLNPKNDDRRLAQKFFSTFKHIIVDEVQDINRTQYQLLELLVGEWDASLDNTLCLVGDPKQSIYRFREADVGLFLNAKECGLANTKLEVLELNTNFRSSAGIVDFNNAVYGHAFPSTTDISMGAMPYVPSNAAKSASTLDGVFSWCLEEDSPEIEGKLASDAVQESFAIDPTAEIAILVRSRSHLKTVADQLTKDGIEYQAIEIENIASREPVQDALTLARAIMHPMDSVSWLALLRTPSVGLCLQDLTTLLEDLGSDSVLERLSDDVLYSMLTDHGKNSVNTLRGSIDWLQENRMNFDSVTLIKAVWFQLGMAAGYNANSLDDVSKFFDLLSEFQDEVVIDMNELERKMARLYAKPNGSEKAKQVQLMTIHRSKGLEFDVVIIPGLGKKGHGEDASLVMWHEFTSEDSGQPEMMIAPIKGSKEDEIYRFLMNIEKDKSALETVRLLYVATTRAKYRLYLIGHSAKGKPTSSSLFSILWPHLVPDFDKASQYIEVLNDDARKEDMDLSVAVDVESPALKDTVMKRVTKIIVPSLFSPVRVVA